MQNKNLTKWLCFLLSFIIIFRGFSQNSKPKQKPVYYFNPQWSPDGSHILFESTLNGESFIYSISKNGSELKQITEHSSGQAAWSPDGNSVVYYRDINGNLQLFVNSASGGKERQLLFSNTQDYGPTWSAKGLIAFMSNATTDHLAHSIFTISEDGTGLKKITDSSFDCMQPRWSPDGKEILYVQGDWTSKTYKTITRDEMEKINNSTEVMVMRADGSNSYRITDNASKYQNASWSADGKAIYVKSENDTSTLIYKIDKKQKKFNLICRINKRIGSFNISSKEDLLVFEYSKNKKYSIYVFDIRSSIERKLIGDV